MSRNQIIALCVALGFLLLICCGYGIAIAIGVRDGLREMEALEAMPDYSGPATPRTPPQAIPSRQVAPGIWWRQDVIQGPSGPMALWVYLPQTASAAAPLPALFIAPAGTRLYHGAELGDGSRPEHLPYLQGGFAVVAYELDGPADEMMDEPTFADAVRRFDRAEFGVANLRAAMEHVRAKVPQIDAKAFYLAGHSSAGTVALQGAAALPQDIRGCIAYAPVVNVPQFIGADALPQLNQIAPGLSERLGKASPSAVAGTIACPLFLFHAADDSVVGREEIVALSRRVNTNTRTVTERYVATGDHYDSMIAEGIPAAIAWLRQKEAERKHLGN